MLSLKNGGAVCDLLPEVGGAVGRFAIDRPDILREVLVSRGQWHAPDSYDANISDLVS